MLTAENTKLPGVKLIKPDIFTDARGDYVMIYQKEQYAKLGITCEFVEHCISTSSRGVIRGIHGDPACDKLIQVLHGSVWYCLVDTTKVGCWESFILSERNRVQLYKPRQYAAGLLALTDGALFHYAQSAYYDPKRQLSWRYDDPQFQVEWPMTPIMISPRDRYAKSSLLWG